MSLFFFYYIFNILFKGLEAGMTPESSEASGTSPFWMTSGRIPGSPGSPGMPTSLYVPSHNFISPNYNYPSSPQFGSMSPSMTPTNYSPISLSYSTTSPS